MELLKLWFDVEKKNYTTASEMADVTYELWFDVEKKNYTTHPLPRGTLLCCGLM